ncbi:MAG: N-acetylneuraminate synthase [Bacteroidota bacterium]|nr:N-acetylneuraminate synthase [Bacteroidota bacterium]
MKEHVLIIAEAGVNHNGSLEIAKQLIDVAVEAGVDIIKFQTFKAKNLVSRYAKKADYQKTNMSGSDDMQFEMLKKLELSEADHYELIEYCKKYGIEFWSTAFDEDSIRLLKKLGINRWKIPSGEITNLPLLQIIGSFNKEIILSSGMCTLAEIEDAIHALTVSGTSKDKITVLHCNTEYPTPMEDVNLNAMLDIREKLKVGVGYSDHTLGIEVPVAAVAMGASVIEKHFTLDKNMDGPDHKASLEPGELKQMVSAIRNIEKAMGDGIKKPSPSETKNMVIARKSIHLVKAFDKGHVLTKSDLVMKRPGNGISPMEYNQVIGKKLLTNLGSDHMLNWDELI